MVRSRLSSPTTGNELLVNDACGLERCPQMGNTFRGGQDNPHRKGKIVVGSPTKDLPALSIQCFERRHTECEGHLGFMASDKCECRCHEPFIEEKVGEQ